MTQEPVPSTAIQLPQRYSAELWAVVNGGATKEDWKRSRATYSHPNLVFHVLGNLRVKSILQWHRWFG